MYVIPQRIDPKVKKRCVQQMLEQVAEDASATAAADAVLKAQWGERGDRTSLVSLGADRLWGERGATSEEMAEIKILEAKVCGVEDDMDILRRAAAFFVGELDPRDH